MKHDIDKVREATFADLRSFDLVLTNDRGDELWRWFNRDDGKPRWKVWAVEPTYRTIIRKWQLTEQGADYFHTPRKSGPKYIGSDYIVPRKYLRRVAKLLGLKLMRNRPRPMTEKQHKALAKGRAVKMHSLGSRVHV